jgi:hypothetical protein
MDWAYPNKKPKVGGRLSRKRLLRGLLGGGILISVMMAPKIIINIPIGGGCGGAANQQNAKA